MKSPLRKIAPLAIVLSLLLTGTIIVFGQVSDTDNSAYYANSSWRLVIDGQVSNPLNLSLSDIAAMPKIQLGASLYCEGVLIADGEWVGIQIAPLLEKAGINLSATDLEFHASDGYAINVAIAAAEQGMVIAYELNGEPLSESLRLVLPGYEGMYWISMITEIDVTNSTNYTIGPPEPSIGIVVTPQPTQTSLPLASPEPVTNSTPTPTQQPTSSPSPTFLPTSQPTLTPVPTQETNSTQPTETPSTNPTETPTTTNQPPTPQATITPASTTSTQTQNQTTPTPNTSPIGDQQSNPKPSASGTTMNYVYAILFVVFTTAIVVGLLVFKRRTNH
jgi:hypothetical protein